MKGMYSHPLTIVWGYIPECPVKGEKPQTCKHILLFMYYRYILTIYIVSAEKLNLSDVLTETSPNNNIVVCHLITTSGCNNILCCIIQYTTYCF